MAEKKSGFSREFIIHPGETLKEILDERGMSQKELALRTGVTESHVSSVINGRKGISVKFAKKLEYALGVDTSFWINLQANYDKELADFEDINMISDNEIEILDKLKDITKYLKQNGLLDPQAYGPILVIKLREFLNVSNLEQIPKLSQALAYRVETNAKVDPYVLLTWLRMCDLITEEEKVEQKLDKEKLKEKIPLMRELVFKEGITEIEPQLKEYLAECGIKFSIVRHFRGAPVQGVIQKNDDGTLSLVMTVRRKFADIFWFTFFHEIGHIVNGDVEDKLIDYESTRGEAENRADEFAANVLIDAKEYRSFVERGDYSLPCIEQFCVEHNMPPYILIGRLQKDRHIKYDQYPNEKLKYDKDGLAHLGV